MLNLTLKAVSFAFMAVLIAACASPKFPETGTPSPYDGKWIVEFASQDNPNCNEMTGDFEVRYGYAIGLVEWRHENYDIWGQIDGNAHMESMIGQLGVSGATANVQFAPTSAEGTWESKRCGKGTLKAMKTTG